MWSTKIPRFAFEKFPQANDRLTTQMKSVGEVMAIGRHLPRIVSESTCVGLEVGVNGLDQKYNDRETICAELRQSGPEPYPGRYPMLSVRHECG